MNSRLNPVYFQNEKINSSGVYSMRFLNRILGTADECQLLPTSQVADLHYYPFLILLVYLSYCCSFIRPVQTEV